MTHDDLDVNDSLIATILWLCWPVADAYDDLAREVYWGLDEGDGVLHGQRCTHELRW